MNNVTPVSKVSSWQLWAVILITLYMTAHLITWDRTLLPDEIRPLLVASGTLPELLDFARQDLVQTPLSYVIQKGWLDIFGHTDTAAKFLPVLIGILTLVLFTFLARQITPHWRLAALLFCAVYLRVGGSVNQVRMYGLALLMAVLGMLLWNRWRRDGATEWLILWSLAMTLLVYSHGSGLLLLPAFAVATWLYGPRDMRKQLIFVCAAAFPVIALLPWLAYVLPVFQERGISANVQAIQIAPNSALARLPFFFLSGEQPGGGSPVPILHQPELMWNLMWPSRIIHLGLFVIAVVKLREFWRSRQAVDHFNAWYGMPLILCLVPAGILYAFSVLVTPVLNARYLLVTIPAYILLLTLIGNAGGRAGRFILLCIVTPWLLLSGGLTLKQHLETTPLRADIELVTREIKANDMILCDSPAPTGWQVYWEWTRALGGNKDDMVILDVPWIVPWLRTVTPATHLDELALDGIERIWFFHQRWKLADKIRGSLMEDGFLEEMSYPVHTSFLTVFRRQE